MAKQLEGKRIAFLATDGFEQIELTVPRNSLQFKSTPSLRGYQTLPVRLR